MANPQFTIVIFASLLYNCARSYLLVFRLKMLRIIEFERGVIVEEKGQWREVGFYVFDESTPESGRRTQLTLIGRDNLSRLPGLKPITHQEAREVFRCAKSQATGFTWRTITP